MLAKVIEVTKITPEDQFNELPDKELLIKDYEDLSIFDETEIKNKVRYTVIPIGIKTTTPAIKLFLSFAKILLFFSFNAI